MRATAGGRPAGAGRAARPERRRLPGQAERRRQSGSGAKAPAAGARRRAGRRGGAGGNAEGRVLVLLEGGAGTLLLGERAGRCPK